LTEIEASILNDMGGTLVLSIPGYTVPPDYTGWDARKYFYLLVEGYYYAVYAYDDLNPALSTAADKCEYKAWGLSNGQTVCSSSGNECSNPNSDMSDDECCDFVVLNN